MKQQASRAIRRANNTAAPLAIRGRWSSIIEDVNSSFPLTIFFVKSEINSSTVNKYRRCVDHPHSSLVFES
jgi:hypothetical protein